jgi:Porin subfamily
MKIVKSFLLASAAGLAAVAGAEAADLPVKARAAEYVKICSLYGVGFYYIPGTDTCIRIGGQVRAEYSFFAGGSHIQNWGSNQAFQDRATDYYFSRGRAYLNMDVRQQTDYGVLRSYAVVKWEYPTATGTAAATQTLGIDVGFIQWGGFIIGRIPDSYFSMPWNNASYFGTSVNLGTSDWTVGRFATAYTYQFGNGVSGSLSIEEAKPYLNLGSDRAIFNGGAALASTPATIAANNTALFGSAAAATAAAFGVPGALTNSGGGQRAPDVVGQIRVDQAWGIFQVAGAAHLNHALYYGAIEPAGNPSDKWGGAGTAGLKLNVPTGKGDFVALGGSYAVGASAYSYNEGNGGLTSTPAMFAFNPAPAGTYQTLNFGYLYDAVYATDTELKLTTTYGGNIAFWHNWNPQWASSLNAGYVRWHYGATANAILCNAQMGGVGATTLVGRLGGGVCNMDYSIATLGSRTVWTPVKDFIIGAEVLASFHHSWNSGQTYTGSTADAFKPATVYWLKDNAFLSGHLTFRRFF